MNFLQRLFGQKDSQARIALTIKQVGNPLTTPRDYEGFSKQAYMKSVVVYRCISLIAKSCAGIKWELKKSRMGGKDVYIDNHDILKLLHRPNPMQGQSSFFESVVSYYCISGNAFIESVRPSKNKPPTELWPVRPDKMKIVPGSKGYPAKYILSSGDTYRSWDVNPVTLQADIYHMKSFHPTNEWWGMSPLEAAMYAVDTNKSGDRWNLALLQNSATPSGVLQTRISDTNPAGALTEEQFLRLKTEIENEYSGASNAGRPMLLEGGLEWKTISMSPKDMEFLKSKESSSIDICNSYGVPPEMLGLGQKTYQNYNEARMSFYEDTVLPLMDLITDELNNWLIPMFGQDLKLCYDKDDIEALASKREAKFAAIKDANFLMINEKREAAGYDPKPGWDVFLIGSDLIDDPEDYMAGGQEDVTDSTQSTPPQNQSGTEADKTPTEDDSMDENIEEEGGKGWKNFNLLNQNERKASAKRQNWRRKRLEAAFTRDLNSDFKEMAKDMADAMKGKTDARVIEYALLKVVDDSMPVIKKTISRHIKYTVEDFGSMVFNEAKSVFHSIETKQTREWDAWAKRYVEKRSGQAIGQIEDTTRKQVSRTVKRLVERAVIDGDSTQEIANELSDEFQSLGKSRAKLISRTEVAAASNNSSLEAVKSMKIPNMMKEWVSAQDDRVRDGGKDGDGPDHEHMNGVSIGLEEKFSVPPDAEMDGPGDTSAGAGQVCNCRCVLVFKSNN